MMGRRALFFQVRTNQEKLLKIWQIAQEQFDNKKPLLIKTSDEKSSIFIDEMLWSLSSDSFLPHEISLTTSLETICITHTDCNPNQAKTIFNLTSSPITHEEFSLIYDFDELTPPPKKRISEEKIKSYKLTQISIASF